MTYRNWINNSMILRMGSTIVCRGDQMQVNEKDQMGKIGKKKRVRSTCSSLVQSFRKIGQ